MLQKSLNPIKRTVPAWLFTEVERNIIAEDLSYEIKPIVFCGKVVSCIEFSEDAFNAIEKIETRYLLEANDMTAEDRGFATRCGTILFQSIRELGYINGNNLIEVGKSLKAIGRVIALTATIALGNIDRNYARRLLPLVRSI